MESVDAPVLVRVDLVLRTVNHECAILDTVCITTYTVLINCISAKAIDSPGTPPR